MENQSALTIFGKLQVYSLSHCIIYYIYGINKGLDLQYIFFSFIVLFQIIILKFQILFFPSFSLLWLLTKKVLDVTTSLKLVSHSIDIMSVTGSNTRKILGAIFGESMCILS